MSYLTFDSLPKSLKKLLTTWMEPENWSLNLQEVCEKAGVNYNSARTMIARVGSVEFYDLKSRLFRQAACRTYGKVLKALVDKAISGNIRAIELYFRLTGHLTDRYEIKADLSTSIVDELVRAKEKLEKFEV
ncbi:hypothetical protein TST_0490 [Thermosulfidibacter takaii ABI70S6]|uniref:Uncharacterized protein n=2 Tax=Thermosulfidibacter takaii TaxID=412593 RepID=A0A0S3QSN4_THET7|nr:hypothetical protein TST_0490 [Thermosulfidibacter takaii ABI70S6]